MCLPPKINLAVNYEGDIFAMGGSFSFRRTWVNYIPAVTQEKAMLKLCCWIFQIQRNTGILGEYRKWLPPWPFSRPVTQLLVGVKSNFYIKNT